MTRHIIQPLTTDDLAYCDHMNRAPYTSLLDLFNSEIGNGKHILDVVRDDGPYRHLQVTDTRDNRSRYDIITWPKYLTIAGERGSFTFAAGPDDMLPLFDRQVNPGYWAEKLKSMHPNDVFGYNDLHFKKWLLGDFWRRSRTLDHDQTTEWWESLGRWLLSDSPLASIMDEADVLHALAYIDAPRGHYVNTGHGMWDTNDFHYEYSLAVILAGVRTYLASRHMAKG
ncbi:hypothetical protein GCM10009720_16030 [Yaniella flava]|uniref:Uncharacterized protein n=1 Tax=Yaniella flava TaxID=287930 RepID=A0ABN2UF35_9MICC